MTKKTFRVTHQASGHRYYVLADSGSHAIEIVTLHLGDAEGVAAWSTVEATPPAALANGVILDGDGRPIRSVEC